MDIGPISIFLLPPGHRAYDIHSSCDCHRLSFTLARFCFRWCH